MAEVKLVFELAHPPERVWRALTDARVLGEWFMPNDVRPTEGAQFTLDPGTLPGFLGTVTGEVTELVAPRRLVMLWQGEKLHTKVSWELSPQEQGCALQLVQTGFIGAPAAIRRRALRATYTELFEQRLPATLDRLAAGALDWEPQVAAPAPRTEPAGPETEPVVPAAAAEAGSQMRAAPAVRAAAPAVPKQRRGTANVALGAWSAGRRMAVSGDPAAPTAEPDREGAEMPAAPAGPPARPRPPVDVETGDDADPPPAGPAWRRRLSLFPAWVRTVTLAGAAAVLLLVVLAAAMWTTGSGPGLGVGLGGDRDQGEPGAALQPGQVTEGTDAPPGGSGGASPGGLSAESAGPGPGGAGVPGVQPGGAPDGSTPTGGPPEGTSAPQQTTLAGSPVLTASFTSSGGLLGLGSRSITVTVSNPGPADATGWEVVMDVGDQDVSNVSGANHRQDGPLAIFTPAESGPAAGGSAEFSYQVEGLLADDPSSCTIDGRPCD